MNEQQKNILSWILTIGGALVLALLLITFVFRFHYISGSSMETTLHDKEFVFVNKIIYRIGKPKRGDVVNTHYPEDGEISKNNYSKRVIGMPGDTIEIKNSVVYINGDPEIDKWMGEHNVSNMKQITITEGHYFVMGDNRSNSKDSREVGLIPESYITGKIQFVLFPFNKIRIIR